MPSDSPTRGENDAGKHGHVDGGGDSGNDRVAEIMVNNNAELDASDSGALSAVKDGAADGDREPGPDTADSEPQDFNDLSLGQLQPNDPDGPQPGAPQLNDKGQIEISEQQFMETVIMDTSPSDPDTEPPFATSASSGDSVATADFQGGCSPLPAPSEIPADDGDDGVCRECHMYSRCSCCGRALRKYHRCGQ